MLGTFRTFFACTSIMLQLLGTPCWNFEEMIFEEWLFVLLSSDELQSAVLKLQFQFDVFPKTEDIFMLIMFFIFWRFLISFLLIFFFSFSLWFLGFVHYKYLQIRVNDCKLGVKGGQSLIKFTKFKLTVVKSHVRWHRYASKKKK